jgi:uncharacterized protein YecT (DUF1311 family)
LLGSVKEKQMNGRILILVSVLLVLSPAFSQKKKAATGPCKGETQYDLNVCAGEEFKRADAELNRVYQQLLKAVEGDKLATTKIKWAEQTWIVYRDAYLEAMFPMEDKQEYGSIYPMEYASTKAELTRTQTAALKELLRAHSPE